VMMMGGGCIGNNTFVFEISVIPSWVIGLLVVLHQIRIKI